MRAFVQLVTCILAGPALAAAEPWEGNWSLTRGALDCAETRIEFSRSISGRYEQCDTEGCRSLSGDEGSITGEQEADPWLCYIQRVTKIRDLESWIFDVECGAEGVIWEARTMVMRTAEPEGLAAYNLGWEGYSPSSASITQLYRCARAD